MEELDTQRVFMTLAADLHGRMKAAAAQRGVNLPEVYTEAAEQWLAAQEDREIESPFGKITPEERDYLLATLNYVRRPGDRVVLAMLDALVRDRKGPQSAADQG